jgi:hypothetical protein
LPLLQVDEAWADTFECQCGYGWPFFAQVASLQTALVASSSSDHQQCAQTTIVTSTMVEHGVSRCYTALTVRLFLRTLLGPPQVMSGRLELAFAHGEGANSGASRKFLAELLVRLLVHKEGDDPDGYHVALRMLVASVADCPPETAADEWPMGVRLAADMTDEKVAAAGGSPGVLARLVDESLSCYGSSSYPRETTLLPLLEIHAGAVESAAKSLAAYKEQAWVAQAAAECDDPKNMTSVRLDAGSVDATSEPRGVSATSDYALASRAVRPVECGPATVTSDDVTAFVGQPLRAFVDFAKYTTEHESSSEVPDGLPYRISASPVCATKVAQDAMKRLTADCAVYAEQKNTEKQVCLAGICPGALDAYEAAGQSGDSGPPAFAAESTEMLDALLAELGAALAADTARVSAATAHVLLRANEIPLLPNEEVGGLSAGLQAKCLQHAGLHARITLPQLVAALMSTTATEDLRRCNSFLDSAAVDELLAATTGICLLTNRAAQARGAIGAARGVKGAIAGGAGAQSLRKEIDSLTDCLLGARHYVTREGSEGEGADGEFRFDPRFLVFEFMFGWLLRDAQVRCGVRGVFGCVRFPVLIRTSCMTRWHAGRCTWCARSWSGRRRAGRTSTATRCTHLVHLPACHRGACVRTSLVSILISTHSLPQVHSMVHQMIMGAGKTTCLAPLLALMLSDGRRCGPPPSNH